MAQTVYILCGLTCLMCAIMLLRGYRRTGARLLMWSTVCFVMLTVNNILLFLDKIAFPHIDLSLWRQATALAAILPLVIGLVWDSES